MQGLDDDGYDLLYVCFTEFHAANLVFSQDGCKANGGRGGRRKDERLENLKWGGHPEPLSVILSLSKSLP